MAPERIRTLPSWMCSAGRVVKSYLTDQDVQGKRYREIKDALTLVLSDGLAEMGKAMSGEWVL